VWRRLAGRCHRQQAARNDCRPEGWTCSAKILFWPRRSVDDSSARLPRSCGARHSGLFAAIWSCDVQPAVCMSRIPKNGRPNYTSARTGWASCGLRVQVPDRMYSLLQNGPVGTPARRTYDCTPGQEPRYSAWTRDGLRNTNAAGHYLVTSVSHCVIGGRWQQRRRRRRWWWWW
jgi:hypothetical protein